MSRGVHVRRRDERKQEPVYRRRRGEECNVVRIPAPETASHPDVVLHGTIGQEHQDRREKQQRPHHSQVLDALRHAQRFAEQQAVQGKQQQRHGHEDRTVAAGERLQGDEARGQTQIAFPSTVEIGVQRRQSEGDPLHVREVDLLDAKEPRGGALEDDSADHRGGDTEAHTTSQHVRPDAAEHARQQGRDVRREQQVAGQPDDRGGEKRNADQVLAVGERQVLWMVDIGFEDRPRPMEKCVRVPAQDVPSDLAVRASRKPEARRDAAKWDRPATP